MKEIMRSLPEDWDLIVKQLWASDIPVMFKYRKKDGQAYTIIMGHKVNPSGGGFATGPRYFVGISGIGVCFPDFDSPITDEDHYTQDWVKTIFSWCGSDESEMVSELFTELQTRLIKRRQYAERHLAEQREEYPYTQ